MSKAKIFIFSVFLAQCSVAASRSAEVRVESAGTQKIEIGEFKTRGLWTPATKRGPAILMIPGSGPQGPEEMMPSSISNDGKDHPLFNELAKPFIDNNVNVLQLGKPGVEFFSTWPTAFYDQNIYANLSWNDLLNNVRAGAAFLRSQPNVDPTQIYLLGHSEGTQVVTDVARADQDFKGIILLGYSARSLIETLRWQLSDRSIDFFVKPDVDANKDDIVTIEEANRWPGEFRWQWQPGQKQITIAEIRKTLASDPQITKVVADVRNSKFCKDGHCERPLIYEDTLKFSGDIFVFTGELDLQTRADEARTLADYCNKTGRSNCHVEIVSGVQHGFNLPKPPRRHPLLDIAVAPVEESFLKRLHSLAKEL